MKAEFDSSYLEDHRISRRTLLHECDCFEFGRGSLLQEGVPFVFETDFEEDPLKMLNRNFLS